MEQLRRGIITRDADPQGNARMRRAINRLLDTRVVAALCAPRHIDDYLELLDSAWSVRETRARIVRVVPESGDATSLWLRPSEHWRGFRAGQYVSVSVPIDGVRYARCFSLSWAPEDGLPLRITIKSLQGGRLAGWAAQKARAGDVVVLSPALGDFVLPAPTPSRLLFISGGSGITPIASMLRHLLATGYSGSAVSLHYTRQQALLGAELAALAAGHPRFRLVNVATDSSASRRPVRGRFCAEQLTALVPDYRERDIFVCGPAGLQAAVLRLAEESKIVSRVRTEQFLSGVERAPADAAIHCRIRFARSGRELRADSTTSLLEQAERAGLRPAHGCRQGICRTCVCKKLSGVVRHELTGALSTERAEEIQLCVNRPASDVVLDL